MNNLEYTTFSINIGGQVVPGRIIDGNAVTWNLWKLIATSPANIRYEILKTWYKIIATVDLCYFMWWWDRIIEKKCYDAIV